MVEKVAYAALLISIGVALGSLVGFFLSNAKLLGHLEDFKMSRLAVGAHIEPLTSSKWLITGPWCALVIERDETTAPAVWNVRPQKEGEPSVSNWSRCEGALSDAYSRVMGYTRA